MKQLRRDYNNTSAFEAGQSSLQLEPARANLAELLPVDLSAPKSSVLFKLTDECSAVIQEAAKKGYRIRLNYTKEACTVEVGYDRNENEVKRFTCVVQSIGFPMDVISINKGKHRNISSLNSKIQVTISHKFLTFYFFRFALPKKLLPKHVKKRKNWWKNSKSEKLWIWVKSLPNALQQLKEYLLLYLTFRQLKSLLCQLNLYNKLLHQLKKKGIQILQIIQRKNLCQT